MFKEKITFDTFIRGVIGCIIVVILFLLMKRLSSVLLPFFIAWLIAYLIYPLVKLFQYKLKFKSRPLSIICALFTITVALAAALWIIIPPTIQEVSKIKDLAIEYFNQGPVNRTNIPSTITTFIHDNLDKDTIVKWLDEDKIANTLKNALPKVWKLLTESVNILFSIFSLCVVLLYIIFILLDYEDISEGWLRLLPDKYRPFTTQLVDNIQTSMNTYFRGQALVAFCVGVLFSIGFLIIDFPLAIGLGMFIGLLNMVPYLQIVGFIPTLLFATLEAADTGENFWIILGSALAVFAIVQTIQDTFLVPKIMGKITGLNPAIILLSLSIWGSLLGMLGMIIALPLTTLLLSYYQKYIIQKDKPNQQKKISHSKKESPE